MAVPKVDSEWRVIWETFHDNLFTVRVFARNLLRWSRRKNIFSHFRFDVWPGVWTEANKLTHYLIEHGDVDDYVYRDLTRRLEVSFDLFSTVCGWFKSIRKFSTFPRRLILTGIQFRFQFLLKILVFTMGFQDFF